VAPQELKCTSTRNVFVFPQNVVAVEQLDDGLSGIALLLEKIDYVFELVDTAPVEQPGSVASKYSATVGGLSI
jgi:hypothetical protein